MHIDDLIFLIHTYTDKPYLLRFKTIGCLIEYLQNNIEDIQQFEEVTIKTVS